MAAIKLRVKAEAVVSVEKENYRDAYDEKSGTEGQEIPDDFVLAAYTNDLEEGTEDLDDALEGGSVDVQLVTE